jgi:hypothetical protein
MNKKKLFCVQLGEYFTNLGLEYTLLQEVMSDVAPRPEYVPEIVIESLPVPGLAVPLRRQGKGSV